MYGVQRAQGGTNATCLYTLLTFPRRNFERPRAILLELVNGMTMI